MEKRANQYWHKHLQSLLGCVKFQLEMKMIKTLQLLIKLIMNPSLESHCSFSPSQGCFSFIYGGCRYSTTNPKHTLSHPIQN